jgi:hypothetical protein
MTTIRPKDRDAVLQSLRAGVVPRVGQHLIQVGRVREVEALLTDIERVADGGSSFRIVIGVHGDQFLFQRDGSNQVQKKGLAGAVLTYHDAKA